MIGRKSRACESVPRVVFQGRNLRSRVTILRSLIACHWLVSQACSKRRATAVPNSNKCHFDLLKHGSSKPFVTIRFGTAELIDRHLKRPKPPGKNLEICRACGVITFNRERRHLCSNCGAGRERSNDT